MSKAADLNRIQLAKSKIFSLRNAFSVKVWTQNALRWPYKSDGVHTDLKTNYLDHAFFRIE